MIFLNISKIESLALCRILDAFMIICWLILIGIDFLLLIFIVLLVVFILYVVCSLLFIRMYLCVPFLLMTCFYNAVISSLIISLFINLFLSSTHTHYSTSSNIESPSSTFNSRPALLTHVSYTTPTITTINHYYNLWTSISSTDYTFKLFFHTND